MADLAKKIQTHKMFNRADWRESEAFELSDPRAHGVMMAWLGHTGVYWALSPSTGPYPVRVQVGPGRQAKYIHGTMGNALAQALLYAWGF